MFNCRIWGGGGWGGGVPLQRGFRVRRISFCIEIFGSHEHDEFFAGEEDVYLDFVELFVTKTICLPVPSQSAYDTQIVIAI